MENAVEGRCGAIFQFHYEGQGIIYNIGVKRN